MAIIPDNEADRIAAVHRYSVLDTPPDGAFERITAMAARLLAVPISIVSIVDTDRIWFKSHHGVDVGEIDREPGLCASAILGDEPWLVSDASVDPRTLANPLVAGEFGLRFYAGVPLRTHDGFKLGTLCVIDRQPRTITGSELATLTDLAAVVMDELELRLSAQRTVSLEEELRRSAETVAQALQETLYPSVLPEIDGFDVAARYHVADRGQVGGDFYDVIPVEGGCVAVIGDACGKGTAAAALTGSARWALRTLARDATPPGETLRRLNAVLLGAHPDRYVTVALATLRTARDGAALDVAVGGHPQPLILRGDGTVDPVGEVSPIVGWSPDVEFSEAGAALRSGDVLVMYTDGLLEAVAGHGATDVEAIRALLAPLAGASAEVVADGLDGAVGGTALRDDVAFLVAGVR